MIKNKLKSLYSNDLLHKGLKDTNYYFLANLGNKILAFLIIPIIARMVGVEGFANYDLFLLVSSFLTIVVTLGIDSGIAVLLAESKDEMEKLSFYYIVSLFLSLSLVIIIFLILISLSIYMDKFLMLSFDMWIMIMFYILFGIINYHTFNFLRWQTQAKEAAIVSLLSYVIGMVFGLIFLYYYSSINYYFIGLVIGTFIGSIISLYIARNYIKNFKIPFNAKEKIIELLRLSLPFIPNYVGNNLMQMADRIVILLLFSKYELGLYAIIVRMALMPQFLVGTFIGGFLPVMFNNYQTEKGSKLIKNFFHFYLFVIPLFFILFYFISDLLVDFFAGEQYLHVAYLLPLALTAIMFVNSTQANGFGFSIKRKTHIIIYITFFSLVLNLMFSVFFGIFFGIAGVIFGTLLSGIIKAYIYTYNSEKLYKFQYSFVYMSLITFISIFLSLLLILRII